MAITDYASLQAALADWLNRQDLPASIPTFIQLTEDSLNRSLRTRDMLTRADLTWNSTEMVPLPTDCLEVYSIEQTYPPSSSAHPPLEYVNIEGMKQLKAYQPTGITRWYSIFGNYLDLWPLPDATGFSMTLNYYAQIPSLSNNEPTNWLIAKSPSAYLYGTLLQAAPYLKNDERAQVWAAAYQLAISALQSESDRAMRPSTTVIARKRNFGN